MASFSYQMQRCCRVPAKVGKHRVEDVTTTSRLRAAVPGFRREKQDNRESRWCESVYTRKVRYPPQYVLQVGILRG